MDLYESTKNESAITRYLVKFICVDVLLTVYVYCLLRVLDIVLVDIIVGYQPTRSYLLGSGIFFVVSLIFFYMAIKNNWNRLFAYLCMALAAYFPLVTIASFFRVYFGMPEGIHVLYAESFCLVVSDILCGEALANMVFNMSIRALPAVLTVPFLYWLAIRYFQLGNPQGHSDV